MTTTRAELGALLEELDDVELRLVDDDTNRRRYYGLAVRRTLFDVVLVVTKGRIGHKLARREERFASVAELARRYKALLALRLRHGYLPSQ